MLDKQALKLGARILENLPSGMGEDTTQGWIDNPKALQKFLAGLCAPEQEDSAILTRLYANEEIIIGPTTGKETIAKAGAVFIGYFDPDFERWGTNKPGKETKAAPVQVFDTTKNARFEQMFSSLGDWKKLFLTQGQIINFCREHPEKLRQDGYGTFFLFAVTGEPFVADVRVGGGRLGVYVRRFGSVDVWRADGRHRVVVPQLAA